MGDPMRALGSVPPPSYQVIGGGQDALTPSSPVAREKSAVGRDGDDADAADRFKEDYLDRHQVTVVEKSKPKTEVSAADLIGSTSVYGQPGSATSV